MDVFNLRSALVDDYAAYVRGFLEIRDARLREAVEGELRAGRLWPEPLIQLNPAFEPGEWIDELVAAGVLHKECSRIFRRKSGPEGDGEPMRLHRHQVDAIKAAKTGANYVLTTGTGSGKSLAYIVPIVDYVLRRGSGKGIQAVIVYPMNALANSQLGELEKFLRFGYGGGQAPVTFRRYTGQESDEERQAIIASPPDILLTNYVMLELLLTRPYESQLVKAASGLRFLVLDELHTYRGRQGADVALLVRRAADAFNAVDLQCVGTSATLASGGTWDEQRAEVARVATLLFGREVRAEHVIGETLRRATPLFDGGAAAIEQLRTRLSKAPPTDYHAFVADPLASWIETTFGLEAEQPSGRLRRRVPRGVRGEDGAAAELARLVGEDGNLAAQAIEQTLLAGFLDARHPQTGFPAFAFRLHQFISRGDTVYASLEPEDSRYITLQAQQFVPGDRSRILLPLAFCRECGQEYYVVHARDDRERQRRIVEPRTLNDRSREDGRVAGFLYASTTDPWPMDSDALLDRLPEDWVEVTAGGRRAVKRSQREHLPQALSVTPDGVVVGGGMSIQFVPAPFRFCLSCGVVHSARQRSDFGKLATLATEGRSTATTVLSLSAVRHLRKSGLEKKAQKLLSFTDNRQDASLQAGHFNDFVQIGLLRSALYRACLDAGAEGLGHEVLSQRAFNTIGLPFADYASEPGAQFLAKTETERALRDVLGYRLYRDLQRGWRITSPNLEQCGLMAIEYAALDELCAAEEVWQGRHEALATASHDARKHVARVLLDLMRRELAIKVDYLDITAQEQIHRRSAQRLRAPWGFDEDEQVNSLEHATLLLPRSSRPTDYQGYTYLSPRGAYGQFLRRSTTFPNVAARLDFDDTTRIMRDLLEVLRIGGQVERVSEPHGADEVPGYQLQAAAMRWMTADGTKAPHDPLRRPRPGQTGGRVNPFFVRFYQSIAAELHGLSAREHTAQVRASQREEREKQFRAATLPVLFCSPTMELGVDISELNAVNMRNVPPTPANYAQRSGRAGRSGQPALVFTYCASGNSHDQYFFRRPERMVAGSVAPPRLDLANEDLVRSHVQAIWLRETRQGLGSSLKDVLDLDGTPPTLAIQPAIRERLTDETPAALALTRAESVLASVSGELANAPWFIDQWISEVLAQAPAEFERACQRWRGMYRAAEKQRDAAHLVIGNAAATPEARAQAKRLRAEAEAQLELLTQAGDVRQSDFYSYRYFASEGFLPGYSFPRLPLSAYIPGRRNTKGEEDYVSRPRFLAISEFGPKAVIYHEGARYLINRVILPARAVGPGGQDLLTSEAKQCGRCGYLHPITDSAGPDVCEFCGTQLEGRIRDLFRLENVSTRRRDRISSGEEERLRLGYELRTALRFANVGGRPVRELATVSVNGDRLASLSYGHAATLWRVNFGWTRRNNHALQGFPLDVQHGYWKSDQDLDDDDNGADPVGPVVKRVIPYVEDRRNALLLEVHDSSSVEDIASLQAALKSAIQARFQLEESELAAEPLPNPDHRRFVLFYESAEGGAGVLRRLVEDPGALRDVAREALDICHFHPDTGEDLRRAPRAREDCEAACYDCLMSYSNQRDHRLLDRHRAKPLLMKLAAASVSASPTAATREEHLQRLMNQCGSELERRWLEALERYRLRLPSAGQVLIARCNVRPDFLYEELQLAVFIDGPHHDEPGQQATDRQQEDALIDAGYTVVRFRHDEPWEPLFDRHRNTFGVRA